MRTALRVAASAAALAALLGVARAAPAASAAPAAKTKQRRGDFGGDFSASAMSGSTAPGPTAGTMGDKAASAMAIGTGGSGPGNYAENYKTPNYTQYTSQDFKEFLPNYEEMMEKSLSTGQGGSGAAGASSSFSNFSSVNEMLKGFMELQKEQLKVEQAKAEANKAKVDLAMDYDDSAEAPGDYLEIATRSKRSLAPSVYPVVQMKPVSVPFVGAKESPEAAPAVSLTTLTTLLELMHKAGLAVVRPVINTAKVGGMTPSLVKSSSKPSTALTSKLFGELKKPMTGAKLSPTVNMKAGMWPSSGSRSPVGASTTKVAASTKWGSVPTEPQLPTRQSWGSAAAGSSMSKRQSWPGMPDMGGGKKKRGWPGMPGMGGGMTKRQAWPGTGSTMTKRQSWPGMPGMGGGMTKRQAWPGAGSTMTKRQSWPGMPGMGGGMSKRQAWPGAGSTMTKRQSFPGAGGSGGKYYKRQSPDPSAAPGSSAQGGAPPSSFWESLGSKATTWFKNGGDGSSPGAPGGSADWAGKSASSQDSGSSNDSNGGASGTWSNTAPSPPPPPPRPPPSQMPPPSSSWSAQAQGGTPSSSMGSGPGAAPFASSWSGQSSSAPPPQSASGGVPGNQAASGGSNQKRRREVDSPSSFYPPVHGSVSLSNIPYSGPGMPDGQPSNMQSVPNLSFSLNPSTPTPATERPVDTPDLEDMGFLQRKVSPTFLAASATLPQVPLFRSGYNIITTNPSPSFAFSANPQTTWPSSDIKTLSPPISIKAAASRLVYPSTSTYQVSAPTDMEWSNEGSVLIPSQPGPILPLASTGSRGTFEEILTAPPPPPLASTSLSPDYYPVLEVQPRPLMVSGGLPTPGGGSTVNLYRIGRSEIKGAHKRKNKATLGSDNSPIVLYKLGKDSKGNHEMKKIVLDPEKGLIIDQTSDPVRRRRKRSIEENDDDSEDGDDEQRAEKGKDETKKDSEAEEDISEDDTSTEDGKEGDSAEADGADPNGHSHLKNNMDTSDQKKLIEPFLNFKDMFMKRRSSEPSYQYQSDGSSTDYDYDEVQVESDENQERSEEVQEVQEVQDERRRRRVRIDFVQKGSEELLPSGSVETISAGGGRAPGHHEGGGLTVKVKKIDTIRRAEEKDEQEEEEKEERESRTEGKKQERKTLNFFFTW